MLDGENSPIPSPSGVDIRNFLLNEEEKTENVEQPSTEDEPSKDTEAQKTEAEEQVETVTKETTEESVKEPSFNKHPRFKRLVGENKRMAERLEALEKLIKESPKAEASGETIEEVPPAFSQLFGEDTKAYKAWLQFSQNVSREQAKKLLEEAKAAERNESEQKAKFEKQAIDFALNELSQLSDETGIDLNDEDNQVRNKVLSLCSKHRLKTEDGLPDIRGAYDLYLEINGSKNLESQKIEAKKKAVSKTVNKNNSEIKENTTFSPKKLKEIEKRGGLSYLWGLNKS